MTATPETPRHLNPNWLREQAEFFKATAAEAARLSDARANRARARAFEELANRIGADERVVLVTSGPVGGDMADACPGNARLTAMLRRGNPVRSAPLGSMLNPSAHDCLPKLAADEPYFVIRAKDPLAASLVELHAYVGAGNRTAAARILDDIMGRVEDAGAPRPAGSAKYRETFHISAAMETWRAGKERAG